MQNTDTTLAAWGERWLHQRATDGIHRCEKDERQIWKIRIENSELAKLRLSEITPVHVNRWIREQVMKKSEKTGRQHARQTICNAFNTLRVCLRDATEEGLIATNPARECRVPKMPRTTEPWTYLSLNEIDKLEQTLKPGEERNAILFAIYTGLRSGEIWGLRWADVDFKNEVIVVRHSFAGATKSGRVRRVPMLQPVIELLQDQKRRSGHRVLVFANRRGGMRQKGFNAGLKRHLRKAGISRKVRFHDLRHTCASHLVQGSWGRTWSIQEVKEWLGHTDIATTQRYAHLSFGGIQQAAKETNAFNRKAS